MRALEVWYSALDAEILISNAKTKKARKYWRTESRKKAKLQTAEHVFPRMTERRERAGRASSIIRR